MPAKLVPCPECRASGNAKHAPFCSIGQKRSAMSRAAHAARLANQSKAKPVKKVSSRRIKTPAPTPAPVKPLVNRIAMVLDGSSSVRSIAGLLVKAVNSHIASLKNESQTRGMQTYVSLFIFSDFVFPPVFLNQYIHGVGEITMAQYQMGNMTALYDGIGTAIEHFESLPDVNDTNTSFLIVAATDGVENVSRRWSQERLRGKITNLQTTERWTFAFTGPIGCKKEIQSRLGIFAGNVEEWANTQEGTAVMTQAVAAGYSNFMGARSSGLRGTKQFFTTDLSNVSATAIKNLTNLSSSFKVLPVDNATAEGKEWEIRPFVEDRMARNTSFRAQAGSSYAAGNGYYQLTKPEDVQATKDVLIREKTTGAIYGGNEARGLIGMPVGVEVRVKPGNHGNYDIFVKSTSVNRKLVRGTSVLYRVR